MDDPVTDIKFLPPTLAGQFVEIELFGKYRVTLTRDEACSWSAFRRIVEDRTPVTFEKNQTVEKNPSGISDEEMEVRWYESMRKQLYDADHHN